MKKRFYYTYILQMAVFLLFAASGCKEKADLQNDYKQIEKEAALLGDARVFRLDPHKSSLNWTLTGTEGKLLSGSFIPEEGSLVFEKGMLIAGFWQGNVWEKVRITQQNIKDKVLETKLLLDSTPVLKTNAARMMRFELSQVSRQILRSDYHIGYTPGTDTLATHLLQGNLTLADSTLPITLTIRMFPGKDEVSISGNFSFNYPDFGIKHRMETAPPKLSWESRIPVSFQLLFRKYK